MGWEESPRQTDKWFKTEYDILREIFKKLTNSGYTIIAPSETLSGIHILKPVKSFSEICLDYIRTRNTPKSFLYPNNEVILCFNHAENKITYEIPTEKIAFFCIHPCDANSIDVLDRILLDKPEDPYYKARRKSSVIIVLDCTKSDEYCFCESVDSRIPRKYDLWIIPDEGKYYISARSLIGLKLLEGCRVSEAEKPSIREVNIRKFRVDINSLTKLYDSESWRKLSEKCLLCGSCLSSCPTCTCFDMVDKLPLDRDVTLRVRVWDSCIFRMFTRLAGGRIVRKNPEDRFKFRFYHKFVFIKERYGIYGCTGCGRCVSNCSRHIHPMEVVSEVVGNV